MHERWMRSIASGVPFVADVSCNYWGTDDGPSGILEGAAALHP
jgi:hypothetical protein